MRSSIDRAFDFFFSGDRRFFLSASFLLGAIAFLRGIRFPNLWSATQAQVDYSHGFVKRGLFGAVFTHSLGLHHYSRFAAFSFATMALTVGLFVCCMIRSSGLRNVAFGAPLALFASSVTVTYFAAMNGYLDCLLLAMTLAVLLVGRPAIRLPLAIFAGMFCAVLHEGFILLLLPVVLFSFFADHVAQRLSLRATLLYTTAVAATCILAGGLAANMRPWTSAQTAAVREQLRSRVDFPLRDAYFNVLPLTTRDNLKLMVKQYTHHEDQVAALSCLITYVPVAGALFVFARRFCRVSQRPVLVRYGWIVFTLLALCPLGMHLLGYDYGRWWTFACIDLLLALSLLTRALPHIRVPLSPRSMRLAAFLIALNLASGSHLLDFVLPRPYPFLLDTFNLRQDLKRSGVEGYRSPM